MRKVLTQILLLVLIVCLFIYTLGFICLPFILLFTNLNILWSILAIPIVVLVGCIIILTLESSRGEDWDK